MDTWKQLIIMITMKKRISFRRRSNSISMVGKMGGAFGSYTHSGESAQMIYDTMQHVFKMDMVDLGPLDLKEHIINTPDDVRACQDYGKAIGQRFK
jgi:hypothetical protein